MTRRKSIGINTRLAIPSMGLNTNSRLISSDTLVNSIKTLQNLASKSAYSNYNADYYNYMIKDLPTLGELNSIQLPDATRVEKPNIITTPTKRKLSLKNVSSNISGKYKDRSNFTNDIYQSYYKAVRPGAKSDIDAARQAKFLTQKAAFETGYGAHLANSYNYGGHRVNGNWLNFESMDDFTKRDVSLLDRKWGTWRNAKNEKDFVNSITTNNGKGHYAPKGEYQNYYGFTEETNKYLGMNRRRLRCGGKYSRPKAWIGAAISAVTNIAGSIFQQAQQKKAEEAKLRAELHANSLKEAASYANALNNSKDYYENYYNQFRQSYRGGGRRKLRDGVSITDGGYAIPIGNNTFLLRGGSHEDVNETGQTGIGINIGGKNIEAEGGEVIQKTPKEVRIFSKEPIINGIAPADAVRAGANKNKIFDIQQSINGDYNADNTSKAINRIGMKRLREAGILNMFMRNGGYISRPVGRIKADLGLAASNNNVSWVPKGFRGRTIAAFGKSGDIRYGRQLYNHNGKQYIDRWTMTDDGKVSHTIVPYEGQRPIVDKKGNLLSTTDNSTTTPAPTNNIETVQSNEIASAYASAKKNGTTRNLVTTGTPTNNIETVQSNEIASAYASAKKNGTTRNLVTTGTPRSIKTGGRPLNTQAKPSLITASTQPAYTSEDEIDYITSQMQNNGVYTPTDTNPANVQLMQMMGYNPDLEEKKNVEKGVKSDVRKEYLDIKDNPWGIVTKKSDYIGLAADLIGSLGMAGLQYAMADSIQDPSRPAFITANKLPTIYNIRPQLDEADRVRNRMLSDANESSSSVGRLARRNYINTYINDMTNRLYAEKTNEENKMLTQDALNQQQVIAIFNDYNKRLDEARTRRSLMRNQGWQVGLSGISDAVGNFLDQGKQRYSDQQAMRYYMALLPEDGRSWLRRNGVDFFKRGGRIR